MPIANFLSLTKVRPASDIKALPSHTALKATTGPKEQFKTVAHPAAHAEGRPVLQEERAAPGVPRF
jgi:hypothetical protein